MVPILLKIIGFNPSCFLFDFQYIFKVVMLVLVFERTPAKRKKKQLRELFLVNFSPIEVIFSFDVGDNR